MVIRSAAPRVVRGVCAAFAATFVALVAHVAAGGAVPDVLGLAAPIGLSMVASVLLQTRKLQVVRLTLSVIVSQSLFHVLFVMGATGGAHVHATSLFGDALMWGSHLAAALITVVFLLRGEQAIHRVRDAAERLVCWLQVRLTEVAVVPALPARVRVNSDAHREWLLLSQLHAATQPRRGPPTLH
ncbi:MAG: hypothetical protein ACTIJ6_01980 [Leucobacter sp.]